VTRTAGERLPDGQATGAITDTGPSADLQRAAQLVGEGKVLEAIKLYDSVIARDPKNPEALAYRGWLLRLTAKAANDSALIDTGLDYINRAIAADPTFPDAHFFRGLILFQDKSDPAGAVPEFEAFLANNPDPAMVPVVQGARDEAKKAAGQTP
jgi:tetratricopeptide (TPR) repeat protein